MYEISIRSIQGGSPFDVIHLSRALGASLSCPELPDADKGRDEGADQVKGSSRRRRRGTHRGRGL